MKKIIYLSMLLAIGFSTPTLAKLHVVTTTTDLASIATTIGGDLIDVKSLARGSDNPHFLEPKPSYAALLNRADLVIVVGLDLEIGWIPPLLTQSRNPAIQPSGKGFLDASVGLPILEISSGKIDRSEGDVHPMGNPHYWLNPNNGLLIAQAIATRLSALDPSNASAYQNNLATFRAELTTKIATWKESLRGLKGQKVVSYHKSFSYLADWLQFEIAGYVEPKPGIPPTPSHLLSLIDLIKREGIHLILTETYYDPKASQKVATDTGATLLLLPTSVGALPQATPYSGLFDTLVEMLKKGL